MSGTARVGITGERPGVRVSYPKGKKPLTEREKYQKMWTHKEYRAVSPGEHTAMHFLQVAKPPRDAEIIDFGCGTGRGSVMLALMGGLDVTMVDFAPNCIDEEMQAAIDAQKKLTFVERDLSKPLDVSAEYGYCTDVMEHIPEHQVQTVLTNILKSAKKVFFQISTVDDCCGQLIGEKLHMTVKPYLWWAEQFKKLDCYYYFAEDAGDNAYFYVTGWADVGVIRGNSELNVDDSFVVENVRASISKGYRELAPHQPHDAEYMLLAGGPSLNDFEDEIVRKREHLGMPLITVNGTYQWALDRGLKPSAHVMVDAREFNERFIPKVVDDCQYMLASQVHPKVFEKVPHDQVVLWHVFYEDDTEPRKLLDEKYDMWWPIAGGCTVTLRALGILRLLGWKHAHIYGFDSCLKDGQHHAYSQPENDNDTTVSITTGNGKTFECTEWMALQADDFKNIASFFGTELQLAVYGDGLIANMLLSASETETK